MTTENVKPSEGKRLRIRYEPTGEVRPPSRGEWFEGSGGAPTCALFDFQATAHPILRQIVEEDQ